jgi:hypothetical protein
VVPLVRDMGLTKKGAFYRLAFKRSQQAVDNKDDEFDALHFLKDVLIVVSI